jgi:polyhydroxybutyrate depolymerase
MRSFGGKTLDSLADRIGADLVYLDGYKRAWNDARRLPTSKAQKKNVDDVGFVRAVVEHFGRPTIAIGYSNGGQLLHRVLREEHGLLAGAAVISAGLPVDDDFTLVDTAPDDIPVLLFHGTGDPVVPFEGGTTRLLGRPRGFVRSARATAHSYAPATEPVVSRDGEIERADWGRVRQVTQFGAGHVIPNRVTSPAPRFVGPSHHDLDAGEEIQQFFALRTA